MATPTTSGYTPAPVTTAPVLDLSGLFNGLGGIAQNFWTGVGVAHNDLMNGITLVQQNPNQTAQWLATQTAPFGQTIGGLVHAGEGAVGGIV